MVRTPTTSTASLGKEELLEIVTKLLGPGPDLHFLLTLDETSLEQLIVAIRMRLEKTAYGGRTRGTGLSLIENGSISLLQRTVRDSREE